MSDLLIKNMVMPKSCGDCPFFKRGANPMGEDFIFAQPWGDCLVSGEENVIEHDISKDCPLVELPPHGRLIEENKAYDSIMEQTANHYIDMDGVDLGLQNTPTVLEASK